MKVQVLHDQAGKICAVFAPVEGGRKGGVEAPSSNRTVIEVEVQEIAPTDAHQNDRVTATISHVLEHYEVRAGRLVERSGKAAQ